MTEIEVLEKLTDLWADAVQSDLENGVQCLNKNAADEFRRRYPQINRFAVLMHDMYFQAVDRQEVTHD